jgi:MraZ protein
VEGFYGQFKVVMDIKGRIALPSKLRPSNIGGADTPDNFTLTKGLDGCLALYPDDEWQLIQKKIGSLNFTRKDLRYFSRLLHMDAIKITLDRQGRLLIPANLQKIVGLEKEVLVLGVNRWIELWHPETYDRYLSQYNRSYEEVAEKLFDLSDGEEK